MQDSEQRGSSRRSFLKKSAVVAGGLAAFSVMPAFQLGQQLAMAANTDLDMVTMQAGLENLAVKAYQAAAGLNLLDKPVLDIALKFADQHSQHQKAFEAEVRRLGGTPTPIVITKYPDLKTQADILNFAQTLELAAAGTYYIAIGKLQDPTLVKITASIMPLEIEHATILAAALKQDPIPASFVVGKTQDELNTIVTSLAPAADPSAAAAAPQVPSGTPSTGAGGSAGQSDNTGVVVTTLAAIGAAAAGIIALRKRGATTETNDKN